MLHISHDVFPEVSLDIVSSWFIIVLVELEIFSPTPLINVPKISFELEQSPYRRNDWYKIRGTMDLRSSKRIDSS